MTPATPRRTRRLALAMSLVTAALAVLLIVGWVYLWFDDSALSRAARANAVIGAAEPLPFWLRAAGLAAGAPLLALVLWGLWNAFRLFRAYAAGRVLTSRTGRLIRHIGVALVLIPFASTLAGMLGNLAASWNNPEGQRHLVVSVDANALVMLVVGAALIMIGWTLVEAARIADENRQFV